MEDLNKFNQYKAMINKMCGHLSDYFIDKAIEEEDYSFISGALIDYFSKLDVGYLLTRYKELGLDDRIENVDIDINEWYNISSKVDKSPELPDITETDQNTYIKEMVKNRRSQYDEDK